MRILAALASILVIAACAPFHRGTVDNRPDDLLAVTSVSATGDIQLSNGRVVRLYGVRVPDDHEEAGRFLASLRQMVLTKEVSTDDVLDGNPPAVAMTVWEKSFICGNGLDSWDASASPIDEYTMVPVASNLAIQFEGALRPEDLSNPAAHHSLKESLPRSREYGIRYRAGQAR